MYAFCAYAGALSDIAYREEAHRAYSNAMLQSIAVGLGAKVETSYIDLVEKPKEAPPDDGRTGEELVQEAIKKLGLEVIPNESNDA